MDVFLDGPGESITRVINTALKIDINCNCCNAWIETLRIVNHTAPIGTRISLWGNINAKWAPHGYLAGPKVYDTVLPRLWPRLRVSKLITARVEEKGTELANYVLMSSLPATSTVIVLESHGFCLSNLISESSSKFIYGIGNYKQITLAWNTCHRGSQNPILINFWGKNSEIKTTGPRFNKLIILVRSLGHRVMVMIWKFLMTVIQ